MNTITLPNGYKRHGKPELLTFRNPESIDEMEAHCNANTHIWFRSLDGTARQVKVNGAVQRWVRDRNRIRVPVKYGLYEYGALEASDINRVLIPVEV